MYTTRSSEVVKLCSALGEDIFDSLISVTPLDNLAKKVIQFLFDVAVTCFYALIHAFVILLHVITLNVSINSNDAALLIVLVSSNFAEVKGSAFKRFSPQNLFQVSAAGNMLLKGFPLPSFRGSHDAEKGNFLSTSHTLPWR